MLPHHSQPLPGPVHAALAALVLAGLGAAQDAAGPTTAAVVFHVHPAATAGRLELLREGRAAVRAGAPAPAIAAALAAIADAGARPLCASIAAAGGVVHGVLAVPPAVHATVPGAALAELAARMDVLRVEVERSGRAHVGDATAATNHAATVVHTAGWRGQGQVLALVDSGVELNFLGSGAPHPAFVDDLGQSRVLASWSVQGQGLADRSDQNGHGTGVASVAVGRRWSTAAGIADGFAPAAALATYRITRGTTDLATQVDLAAGYGRLLLDVVGGLPARVANSSFGGSPEPTSIDQVAADELALYGDVLLVTSAGNVQVPRNLDFRGTEQSQANGSGLAVGAVAKGTRVLAPFSVDAALPGQGLRPFPDMCAVGQGVRVASRLHTGTTTVDGTSYAAPMVAGTALLVRQVRPELDVASTRAVLLATATDLVAANPGRGPNGLGRGFLRSDRAVQTALQLVADPAVTDPGTSQWRRGSTGAGGTTVVPLVLPPQRTVALALAWLRDTPGSADAPDLDVEVRRGGVLVARGSTPAGSHERLTFATAGGGVHEVTVRARHVPADDVAWALATAAADGEPVGADVLPLAAGCAGSGVPVPGHTVLPAVAGFGGARTNKPLADAPLSLLAAYDGAQVGAPRAVHTLALRLAQHEAPTAPLTVRLRLHLGYTTAAPDRLVTPLGANFAASPAPVVAFDGQLALPATNGEPAADRFDVRIPLATPFWLDGALGNPLVQFEVLGNGNQNAPQPVGFDAAAVTTGTSLGALVQFAGAPFAVPIVQRPVLAWLADAPRGAVPQVSWSGAPRRGQPFPLALTAAREGALAVLAIGSPAAWSGVALPLDLAPFGAAGCRVAAAPEATLLAVTNAAGQATAAVPLANDPALVGHELAWQWLVLDAAANALGVASSDALVVVVGG